MLVRERTTIHSLSDNRVAVTVRFSYAVQRKIPYQLIKSSSTVDEVGHRGARSFFVEPQKPMIGIFWMLQAVLQLSFSVFSIHRHSLWMLELP
jgi:hypothetical protein